MTPQIARILRIAGTALAALVAQPGLVDGLKNVVGQAVHAPNSGVTVGGTVLAVEALYHRWADKKATTGTPAATDLAAIVAEVLSAKAALEQLAPAATPTLSTIKATQPGNLQVTVPPVVIPAPPTAS